MNRLGATPPLTKQLWQRFREAATHEEIGTLVRAQTRQSPEAVAALLNLLTPARLFSLLRQIVPEGVPRDPAVRSFEDQMLQRAAHATRWR